jgi:hypothetical protein
MSHRGRDALPRVRKRALTHKSFLSFNSKTSKGFRNTAQGWPDSERAYPGLQINCNSTLSSGARRATRVSKVLSSIRVPGSGPTLQGVPFPRPTIKTNHQFIVSFRVFSRANPSINSYRLVWCPPFGCPIRILSLQQNRSFPL